MGDSRDPRLGLIDLPSSAIVDLSIPADPDCARERELTPRALADGRLAYIHICQHAVNNRPPDDAELWALDVPSGAVTRVMAIGPLGTAQGVGYTVNADLSEAIVGVGLICGYLVVNSKSGETDRLDVLIEKDGKAFSLADPVPPGRDCPEMGWATQPALSPDGSILAFLASAAAVGQTGSDRLDAPASIYLLVRATGKLTELLGGIVEPGELAWSPKGDRLAFSGKVDGEAATWALPAHGGAAQRLAPPARRLAWSPDGTQILAAFLTADQAVPFTSMLAVVDASEPTSP